MIIANIYYKKGDSKMINPECLDSSKRYDLRCESGKEKGIDEWSIFYKRSREEIIGLIEDFKNKPNARFYIAESKRFSN